MGGLSPSPFCVVVMKVTARSRPAKGWPCLMKTDEAEIKCLPTLRDSFITVSPRAIEHLGLELSFNRPCLTAPWWHTAAFQAHEHLHLYLSFSFIRRIFCIALTDNITVYIPVCTLSPLCCLFKSEWGFYIKVVQRNLYQILRICQSLRDLPSLCPLCRPMWVQQPSGAESLPLKGHVLISLLILPV